MGSGDWSDLLFPRNNIAFNDCSQLFLVTPPLRFSRCLFGLVATSFLLFQRDLTCGFLIICLMFDMRRVDDRDHVFRDPIWGVSSSNCIFFFFLLGSRTNRNYLPNDMDLLFRRDSGVDLIVP